MLPGVNVLLMGPPGTGKTHALRTLIDAGVKEVACLFTEPGMEVMLDTRNASDEYKKAIAEKRVHWKYIPSAVQSWDSMLDAATKAVNFDIGTLQKQVASDKKENTQFMEVLKTCQNFICEQGCELGNVDDWGSDRALVFDSLSGLNIMLLGMAAGSKPIITQPEWGQAIKMEEAFINRLSMGTRCHFVLVAHVDRQADQIMGGIKQMPSALGQKLPPLIGRFFSDVILTVKEGDKFTWSLASGTADTKARNLPNADKLEPSFVPILNQWRQSQNV